MGVRRSTFARGKWSDPRSINGILTDYKKFVGVVEAETERIMLGAAEMTLDYILPYVPVDTGALRQSGKAEAQKTNKGFAAVVTFGGPNNPVTPTRNAPEGIVNYAPVINYDTRIPHAVGQALFLEQGLTEAKGPVDSYIVSELKKIEPPR